jgi:hypothetical protein
MPTTGEPPGVGDGETATGLSSKPVFAEACSRHPSRSTVRFSLNQYGSDQ